MKRVVPVSSKAQLAEFIDFPHTLYANDLNYVPELFIAQRDLLTPGKHPFHQHSQLQGFLAMDGKNVVGRVAAILNKNHNQFNNAEDGFFGFFDCVNDTTISSMLLDEASNWLKQKGAKTIIGPVNFSTNESCGLLVEGFDSPPMAMMTYNYPYYLQLLEQSGFIKKVDLIAYIFGEDGYDDRSVRVKNQLLNRLKQNGVTLRPVDKKNFAQEVTAIREVYNQGWSRNLGFVPMTEEEFNYLANDLKLVLDPDFCLVAEKAGKVIGFALAIPNINEILIKVKKGRLLPLGIFKLLLGLKKIKSIRILALGVLEAYRKQGIEACFYGEIIEAYRRKKYKAAEASWILEHNDLMNRALIGIKGNPYKRYRILEKAL
jgi:GNAT superfamily N-acetyltransferase